MVVRVVRVAAARVGARAEPTGASTALANMVERVATVAEARAAGKARVETWVARVDSRGTEPRVVRATKAATRVEAGVAGVDSRGAEPRVVRVAKAAAVVGIAADCRVVTLVVLVVKEPTKRMPGKVRSPADQVRASGCATPTPPLPGSRLRSAHRADLS